MILEDSLEKHGYARILIAAIHAGEFAPWPLFSRSGEHHMRAITVWQGYEIEQLAEKMSLVAKVVGPVTPAVLDVAEKRVAEAFELMWPGLPERYNTAHPYSDYNMLDADQADSFTLTIYQGNLRQLAAMYEAVCRGLAEPFGGDDTTFDYWPSEFGAAVMLGYDLATLHPKGGYLGEVRGVWDAQCRRWEEAGRAAKKKHGIDTPYGTYREEFTQEVTPRP